jgi:deoxyribodipyrimidine photo-lyase
MMPPVPASPVPAPTLAAAHARIAAVRPSAYANTRNHLDGAVTGLSPYLTHGLIRLPDVVQGVTAAHALTVQRKLVFELGWRAYFQHVWQHRGDAIFASLHEGPLPAAAYASALPADIREARTGVPVIDEAVRTLYATGYLHNHARMWLASYVVHVRKVGWRAGADWLYGHLLDGDLASNHLSWQWVAGTGSHKPYLFNADNVARYAPSHWHSPDTVVDQSYEALDRLARQPRALAPAPHQAPRATPEPACCALPPAALQLPPTGPEHLAGRDVWVVHPWSLGPLPALPPDSVVIGLLLSDFHRAWPWSERRWRFVMPRLAELAPTCWSGDAAGLAALLAGARSVRSVDEPHLAAWLPSLAQCESVPALFPLVAQRCDSFSRWWTRVSRGVSLPEPLSPHQDPLPW